MTDKLLSAAKNVSLSGGTVRRPLRTWSGEIHRFMTHLHEKGLPIPRVLGTDDEYEYTEFLEGGQVHPYAWSDAGLAAVGRLVRALHTASQSFEPRGDVSCADWCLRELGSREGRIWCHGDISPWNVITTPDGLPSGLIDWEFAGPLDPLSELARVCWLFVQLYDDDLGEKYSLPAPQGRAAQVRLLLDAYGLNSGERIGFTERILEAAICETAHEAIDPAVGPEDTGNLWGMAWRTRSVYWIWRHMDILRRALEN